MAPARRTISSRSCASGRSRWRSRSRGFNSAGTWSWSLRCRKRERRCRRRRPGRLRRRRRRWCRTRRRRGAVGLDRGGGASRGSNPGRVARWKLAAAASTGWSWSKIELAFDNGDSLLLALSLGDERLELLLLRQHLQEVEYERDVVVLASDVLVPPPLRLLRLPLDALPGRRRLALESRQLRGHGVLPRGQRPVEVVAAVDVHVSRIVRLARQRVRAPLLP
mmetsp:Transcript_11058/g.51225  ORF Transcript_11058/g.51225 Transcript_11058/m.51225 type:complete len:222 (+) Transcript_11058:182-847(+)